MKRICLIAVSALFACAGYATASDREFADIYTDCGLGALIAPRNDAVAAVTNVTWDSGTTAISSDSSSPESCKGGKESAAAFILDAYPSIESDLARGSGEYLSTLLTIAGCEQSIRSEVAEALRADFGKVAAAGDYSESTRFDQAETLYNVLNHRIEASFGGSCALT